MFQFETKGVLKRCWIKIYDFDKLNFFLQLWSHNLLYVKKKLNSNWTVSFYSRLFNDGNNFSNRYLGTSYVIETIDVQMRKLLNSYLCLILSLDVVESLAGYKKKDLFFAPICVSGWLKKKFNFHLLQNKHEKLNACYKICWSIPIKLNAWSNKTGFKSYLCFYSPEKCDFA